MIKNLIALTLLGLINPLFAEVKLSSATDIIGAWRVDAEAAKYDGEKRALHVTWEFKPGGILKTASKDKRTGDFGVDLSYSIEDGMIKKQSVPGRQKFESCAVIRKDATSMDIKCTYLYFFLSRI
ncbi:MAG: hypothetical protein HOP02_17370 [Methylococcaceae bacterium]|nr:hypothetical protein [Methylococcaceae bacterium]